MRFGMMAAAAACAVVAAPAEAAVIRNFTLEGSYVGAPFAAGTYSPEIGGGVIPFPFPPAGTFSISGPAITDIFRADFLVEAFDEAGVRVYGRRADLSSFTATGGGTVRIAFQDEDPSLLRGTFTFAIPSGLLGEQDQSGQVALNLGRYDIDGGLTLTISSVPEPASWALMILGFGAVSGALRRRQATVTATLMPS